MKRLATIMLMLAALAALVLSAPTVHAAARTASAPHAAQHLSTHDVAATGCIETYWDWGDRWFGRDDGYEWDLIIHLLRDAYTGAFCGQFSTRVCVTVPTYHSAYAAHTLVEDDAMLNETQYLGRIANIFDVQPFQSKQGCTEGSPDTDPNAHIFWGPRGASVLIQGHTYDESGEPHGLPPPYYMYYLY